MSVLNLWIKICHLWITNLNPKIKTVRLNFFSFSPRYSLYIWTFLPDMWELRDLMLVMMSPYSGKLNKVWMGGRCFQLFAGNSLWDAWGSGRQKLWEILIQTLEKQLAPASAFLKQACIRISQRGTQRAGLHPQIFQQVWAETWDIEFPETSQVMLALLVWEHTWRITAVDNGMMLRCSTRWGQKAQHELEINTGQAWH